MEDRTYYVELVKNDISNRNALSTHENYQKEVITNAWKDTEMYRSYFMFSDDFKEHVDKESSVKGFKGITYLDYIILDIDKGTIPNDQFIGYLQQSKVKKDTLELIKPGLVPGPTISGKGGLVHEYAVHTGAKILFSNYQTGWIGFN